MSNAQYYTLPDELLSALRAATASDRAEGFRAGVEAAALTIASAWAELDPARRESDLIDRVQALSPERAERGEGDDWGYKCPECGIDVCNHTVLAHHKFRSEIERLSQPAPPASGAPRCANGHVLGKGPHFCDACDGTGSAGGSGSLAAGCCGECGGEGLITVRDEREPCARCAGSGKHGTGGATP